MLWIFFLNGTFIMPQKKSFGQKKNLNFMHEFKSTILPELKNCQIGPFEPMHGIQIFFGPKDFFWSIMKMTFTKNIPNPNWKEFLKSCESFLRKSQSSSLTDLNPGFGGPWDMLAIFFVNVIFIMLQIKSFGQKNFWISCTGSKVPFCQNLKIAKMIVKNQCALKYYSNW